jgi:hypothetical protein
MATVLVEVPPRTRTPLTMVVVYGTETNQQQWWASFRRIFTNYDSTMVLGATVEATAITNITITGDLVKVTLNDDVIKNATSLPTPTGVVTQLWSNSYYHLIAETLPRILRLHRLDPTMPILLSTAKFTQQVLNYFRITNPVIPYHPNERYHLTGGLYITETLCGNPTKADIELIRESIPVREPTVCILIYRKERTRHVRNFLPLLDTLRNMFPNETWVVFDSQTFDETVELFQQAKVVVGAHGAGLVNTVFCPVGTPVLELAPATSANPCFWHLSEVLGNRHHILPGYCDCPPDGAFDTDIDVVIKVLHTLI